MNKGLQNSNCLRCFFLVKEILKAEKLKYEESFGLVPTFKAGLHYGRVSTGEIGVIKKEIVFSSDVLNTTARIQSACKVCDMELLVSNDLFSLLQPGDQYDSTEIGHCKLRGKDTKIALSTAVQRRPA